MTIKSFYQSYYELARNPGDLAQWKTYIKEAQSKLAVGEPIFVTFKDIRREGAVGRITELVIEEKSYRTTTYGWRSHGTALDPGVMVPCITKITIGFDGRKNVLTLDPWDFNLAPDHDPAIGTVYEWNQTVKPKEPPKIVYDRIGEPVTAGDFVSFVHKQYGRIALRFGTITRITGKGTVFVQTLKLKDGDRSEEVRCNEDNVVIVNDQLMKRLVMAKLAAN